MESPKPAAIVGKQTRYTPNLKLKYARESQGWSQADLARKIEAPSHLITRWERGYAFPSPYYRQKLCTLFEQNAEELGLIKMEKIEASKDEVVSQDSPQTPELTSEEQTEASNDESIMHDLPPIGQNDQHELHEETAEKPDHRQRSISRRAITIGLAGGILVGGIVMGAHWWETRARPVVFVKTTPPSLLVYTYKTAPPTGFNAVVWSPRGTFLASANGNDTAQIITAATGKASQTYRGHTNFVNDVTWSPDGSLVASASADMTVQIWQASSADHVLTYSNHADSVWCAVWSPDGTWLASGSGKNEHLVHVWNASSGSIKAIYRGHTNGVAMVAWSPDSQSLASCGADGTIQVWNALTGVKSDTFTYNGDPNVAVNEVAWSPNGKYLASAHANITDATVQIWDALTGNHLLTCSGHTAPVQTVKWSPDGTLLASGSMDNTVRLWDASTGKQVALYPYHTNVVFTVGWSPDGRLLASGSADETLQVYRTRS